MALKTKTTGQKINAAAGQGGLLLMAAATSLGLVEVPQHPDKRAVLATQPNFAFATEQGGGQDNQIRRERDEVGPHYVSYNITQRTPGRTGRF